MIDETAVAVPGEEAGIFAESILDTIRQPLLILSEDLRVHSANRASYLLFQVDLAETEGQLVYELGNGHWDIPRRHELLSEILPRDGTVEEFEIEHDFCEERLDKVAGRHRPPLPRSRLPWQGHGHLHRQGDAARCACRARSGSRTRGRD